MSEYIAELLGVGHHYDDGPEIFKGVSFNIEAGSFQFLTGPSGSGKSSLLKMLYLGLKPTRGSLHLFGEDPLRMDPLMTPFIRQKIGVVFQEFKLLDHLTIVENISLPLRVKGMDTRQSTRQARELLGWVGLGDCLDIQPSVLSGGQIQRAAIARAVITNPRLLLADEPTGNVDDDMGTKLLYLFEELNRMGTAVMIATHNSQLLSRFHYPQLVIKNAQIIKTHSGRKQDD